MHAANRPALVASARLSGVSRSVFLAKLAETSNVTLAAKTAGISPPAAYRERRRSEAFRKAWGLALAEGYARLEAALLSEALIAANGSISDKALKSRAQKYRLGMTLLSAHRGAVRGSAPAPRHERAKGEAKRLLAERLDVMRDRMDDV
jgi:hypothetical protein